MLLLAQEFGVVTVTDVDNSAERALEENESTNKWLYVPIFDAGMKYES